MFYIISSLGVMNKKVCEMRFKIAENQLGEEARKLKNK